MARAGMLRPLGNEFDRFLYAYVGEDDKGAVVTVLSMLARLGLDPWKEANKLAAIGREAAGGRLMLLLRQFLDVKVLGREQESVAHDLVLLLPGYDNVSAAQSGDALTTGPATLSRGFLFSLFILLVILANGIFSGSSGIGG